MPAVEVNGPALVSFDPAKKISYLMFLKREGDLWVPLTGQIDPADGIKVIDSYQ
jgi:hypothetical protein